MKPPYDITPTTLKLISEISEKLGVVQAGFMDKPTPQLRKQNKIQTIHHSLKMEGNSLSENQITEIVENKRVIGPSKDIREVVNAIDIYDNLERVVWYHIEERDYNGENTMALLMEIEPY